MAVGEGSSCLTPPIAEEKIPGLSSPCADEGGSCPTPHGTDHTGAVKVPLYTLQQMIDAAQVSGSGHVSPLFGAGRVGQVPSLFGAGRVGHVPPPLAVKGVVHISKSGADHAGIGKIPIYTLEQMIGDAALVSGIKLDKERERGTKYGNYCWCDDREYDREPPTHILKVGWTIPMLAKLFFSHDWMSAVQIARKVWDEKTATEQLTILAEAMDMGVAADGDVEWLYGSII